MKGKTVWVQEEAFKRLVKARRLWEEVMQEPVTLSKVTSQGIKLALEQAKQAASKKRKKNNE